MDVKAARAIIPELLAEISPDLRLRGTIRDHIEAFPAETATAPTLRGLPALTKRELEAYLHRGFMEGAGATCWPKIAEFSDTTASPRLPTDG
jgi:hypothetical protein